MYMYAIPCCSSSLSATNNKTKGLWCSGKQKLIVIHWSLFLRSHHIHLFSLLSLKCHNAGHSNIVRCPAHEDCDSFPKNCAQIMSKYYYLLGVDSCKKCLIISSKVDSVWVFYLSFPFCFV